MKLIYIANTRIPTEMAHGLQIMKMCEAFAGCKRRDTQIEFASQNTQTHADISASISVSPKADNQRVSADNIEVELVVPRRFGISDLAKKNPFEYYRVDKNFKIKKIFCLDLTPLNKYLGPVSFLVQAISFAVSAFFYTIFRQADIVYSRDRFSLMLLAPFRFTRRRGGTNLVAEIHQTHRSLFKFVLNKVKKIVVITEGLKRDLIKKGAKENKIIVAGDAIDLNDFNIKETKEECREKLGLPQGKKIVLYAGHLYKWKGVETLALASKHLTSNNVLIVIVGGIKWYLSDFKKFVEKNNLKNVLVLGHKNYSEIPFYLKSADCVVLTGTNKSETSKEHTSPMKMFEYMASKNPIVASSLPSFREILYDGRRSTQIEFAPQNTQINAEYQRESAYPEGDNQRVSAIANAILVEPDDAEAMAIGIKKALNDTELSRSISGQAYQDVQKYTWDNRVKKILEFII